MDVFTSIWEWFCDFFSSCLQYIVDLLPDSPFNLIDMSVIEPYLGYINYFIPFDFIIATFTAWLVAISGYYLWSVVLRWLKAID